MRFTDLTLAAKIPPGVSIAAYTRYPPGYNRRTGPPGQTQSPTYPMGYSESMVETPYGIRWLSLLVRQTGTSGTAAPS